MDVLFRLLRYDSFVMADLPKHAKDLDMWKASPRQNNSRARDQPCTQRVIPTPDIGFCRISSTACHGLDVHFIGLVDVCRFALSLPSIAEKLGRDALIPRRLRGIQFVG